MDLLSFIAYVQKPLQSVWFIVVITPGSFSSIWYTMFKKMAPPLAKPTRPTAGSTMSTLR